MNSNNFLVIGDFCIDYFIYGTTDRINPEVPVPIFKPVEVVENLGMAGNVAENLSSLGHTVDLICNKNKIFKKRYVDKESNHMHLRVDEDDFVNKKDSFQNFQNIKFSKYNAIIITDHNKGFLSHKDIEKITKSHDHVFVQTNKIIGDWVSEALYIKLNKKEYEKSEKAIFDNTLIKSKLIITDGSNGAYFQDKHYPVNKNIVTRDLSGAGDTFLSVFASEIISGKNHDEAIINSQIAASKVVQKRGVSKVGNCDISINFLNL